MSTTSYQQTGNFPIRPLTKPFSNSSQARNQANRRQVPPPEIPVAVTQIPMDPFLTARKAAAVLRVSTETLMKWRQPPGKGPEFVKFPGGAVRYRLSAIMKFLQDCITATSRRSWQQRAFAGSACTI